MNLFNKKILNQRIANYSFPTAEKAEDISKLIIGWQKALKDSDLSKTKEKSIQGKFLSVFFEQILGYQDKTSGTDQWTLVAEPKTEVDAQTADGAIGFFSKNENLTVGAIELKDAKTSLDKKQKGREKGYSPVEQAYMYATKFDRCKWIIVSNFREIRLYNKARSEQFFEKFDVLELHKEEEFRKFYFLLSKENLIAKEGESPIDDLVKKSEATEEDISKHFYTDYKSARQDLYNHLVEFNPSIDKKALFEKSQKILDRIVFILFCEDTANLLPKHILRDTYQLGIKSRDRNDEKVWREMKNLFIDIDEGRSDIDPKINGYNGGLFKYDEVLDTLIIKDGVWQTIIKLADYDFETDLNVNILGHIFEQSISDIESIKSEIEGEEQDKSKSKRKKDGIFYTPEYITKYIVENTVGKYLEEHPDKLSSIKILDPACGSGAFLNQAHSYLLNEYRVRHEQKVLEKHEKGEEMTLFDYNPAEANRAILLNNLYGVDLNDESVEITKLSLWLKTARKDEPLQNLDGNIKVGNSLIDEEEVAGDKAFSWSHEFKDIIDDGGFDVIVGNPPYVKIQEIQTNYPKQAEYYISKYKTATGKFDLYVLFIEQAFNLLKDGGLLAFILPHKFTNSDYGKGLREFLVENKAIEKFISFGFDMIFEEVTAYTGVLILRKGRKVGDFKYAEITKNDLINEASFISEINVEGLNGEPWSLQNNQVTDLMNKIRAKGEPLTSKFEGIFQGIISGDNDAYYLYDSEVKGDFVEGYSKAINETVSIEETITHEILGGKSFERYNLVNVGNTRIIFPYKEVTGKTVLIEEANLKVSYPKTYEYFKKIEERLKQRGSESMTYPQWYSLWNQRELARLNASKIVTADIANYTKMVFDYEGNYFHNDTTYSLILKDDSLEKYWFYLALLNSKLAWFFISNTSSVLRGGFHRFKTKYLKELPIVEFGANSILSENSKLLQELNNKLFTKLEDARQIVALDFININKHTLLDGGFNLFIEEIEKNSKQKIDISKKEELQNWFRNKQSELSTLQKEIQRLDREIDAEVYKLYDLTTEEIAVIENQQ